MVPIRLVGKERKIVCIVDENTPVPHTLARITTVSTNYGLADEARQMHPELMQANKGDWPGAVFNREKKPELVGAVGGAYEEKETDEDIIVNIGDYQESEILEDEKEAPAMSETLNVQAAALATTSASNKKIIKGIAAGGVGAKPNGYCMFIKHIARKNNMTGCISELMAKFDKDWKMLPDHEKAEWKIRAKTGDGRGRGRGSQGRSHSPVASALAPRGRGRGRGRGTPAPVKPDYDQEDDDDDFY